MNTKFFNKEDEIIYNIGNIIVYFQHIERITCDIIHLFIDSDNEDDIGNIMTSELNFNVLLDKLFAIFTYKFPNKNKDIENLKFLIENAKKITAKRNNYVHSKYYLQHLDVISDKKTTRGNKGYVRKYEKIDLEKLKNDVKEIKDLQIGFDNFLYSLSLFDCFRSKFNDNNIDEENYNIN